MIEVAFPEELPSKGFDLGLFAKSDQCFEAQFNGFGQFVVELAGPGPREAGLIETADSSVDVLVTLFDDAGLDHALGLSQQLRGAGLNVETQLEPRKLARQFQYADRAGIRFVVVRGEDEAARGVVAVKDLRRGEQFEVADADLARTLLVEREQWRALGKSAG